MNSTPTIASRNGDKFPSILNFAALALLLPLVSNAFVINSHPHQHRATSGPSSSLSLHMSLKPTFDTLSAKIVEKLGLQETDFTETFGGKTWICPTTGTTGTAEWMSEASPKFLTGVTTATATKKNDGGEEFTLNVWMGPSYDVPHMLLTFGEQPTGKYFVTADYVVRGATPVGSDPRYLANYYGEDVVSAWTSACTLEGAVELPTPKAFASRLLHGPARFSVGNLAVLADAEALVTNHVERFLAWLDEAESIPARSRGSMNLRDDKLRQYFYQGQVQTNVAVYGEELGRILGAVTTGPTAEAYVGGGS